MPVAALTGSPCLADGATRALAPCPAAESARLGHLIATSAADAAKRAGGVRDAPADDAGQLATAL